MIQNYSLVDWVILQREKHLHVTQQTIALQEKEINDIQDAGFKASKGWIDHFMQDLGFTMRTHVNNCWTTFASECLQYRVQLCTVLCITRKVKHTVTCCNCQYGWNSNLGRHAWNVEINWSNMCSFTDYRSSKQRITVCLSALANAENLKPFFVFMDKRISNELKHILGPSLCSPQKATFYIVIRSFLSSSV